MKSTWSLAPRKLYTTSVISGLALLCASLTAGDHIRRDLPYTSPANTGPRPLLHHWASTNVISVGNLLYVHGGEITTWNGSGSGYGKDGDGAGNVTSHPNNETYSIDLTKPWSNDSVAWHSIPSSAPVLVSQALWKDSSGSTFYAYDGGISGLYLGVDGFDVPPVNALWQFKPDAKSGDGEWSTVNFAATSNFSSLIRAAGGYSAYGGGLGFVLGGNENSFTQRDYHGDQLGVPGLVMYNFTSGNWYNISATGFSQGNIYSGGSAHFVPSYGPEGLVLFFGGLLENSNQPGLQVISIFEPQSQQWSSMNTSGTPPPPVVNPCVVGAQGDIDNTYEIYMFGGSSSTSINDTQTSAAVHVLSLPAFVWKSESTTTQAGRYLHDCEVIGNRQMVVVGGRVIQNSSAPGSNGLDSVPDPWQQALGIFDMSEMMWRDSFDPSAPPYVTPSMVKAYYQEYGTQPASGWTDDLVKGWFMQARSNSSSTSNSTKTSETSSKHSTSNAGAIAGGVVGGVVGLAIIALIVFCCFKRRRRSSHLAVPTGEAEYRKPELSQDSATANASAYPTELSAVSGPIEMPQKEHSTSELPSKERAEVAG